MVHREGTGNAWRPFLPGVGRGSVRFGSVAAEPSLSNVVSKIGISEAFGGGSFQ